MNRYPVEPGCVVTSLMGRDRGRTFIVTRSLDADFVLMTDGDTRPLDKQKKKRRKHLRSTGAAFPELIAQLSNGQEVTDAQVRKLLKEEG